MTKEEIKCFVEAQVSHIWMQELRIPQIAWDTAYLRMQECLKTDESVTFTPYHGVKYAIYLYFLANTAYKMGTDITAPTLIYGLNRMLHCVDWFYEIDLPDRFGAEHPLGSVLGRASYSNGLFVYQGTTIGGSPGKDGLPRYPKLGENVVLFANSSVLGDCTIGNHVMLSAGSQVINANIPDNAIVFGRSPQLEIHIKDSDEMTERTARFCLKGKIYKPYSDGDKEK